MTLKLANSKGEVFYGMHFYPGVAEYAPPNQDPFRIFINEDTIRKMNPTFAGRPIFVEHVDGVDDNLDDVKHDADGWVVESFFNQADGKTWAKFIVVSKRGLAAIKNGYRLSNAYVPTAFARGGLWNGVSYEREVTDGQHEHLAIVKNPRYEESQVLTPEQFKEYNQSKQSELTRLANSKEGETEMKLNFFKRKVEKLENGADLQDLSVTLPKSGVEKTIIQLVNEADAAIEQAKAPRMANDDDMYMMGNDKMTVGEMAKQFNAMKEEMAKSKANAGGTPEQKPDAESLDNGEELPIDDKRPMENEEDDEKAKKEKADKEKMANEADDKAKAEKAKADAAAAAKKKENFDKLANAQERAASTANVAKVEIMADQVQRGKVRYGSA